MAGNQCFEVGELLPGVILTACHHQRLISEKVTLGVRLDVKGSGKKENPPVLDGGSISTRRWAMVEKVKDHGMKLNRKCSWCFNLVERMEVAGDEREVVVIDVCLNCGMEFGERVEEKRK